MNVFNKFLIFLKSKQESISSSTPEGLCPNCWGRQEYGNKFYKAMKTYDIDINTNDVQVGWIQDYFNKNLRGITLESKEDGLVCGNCKIKYKII